MLVHVPTLWDRSALIDFSSDSIELAAIVPRVGERRRVYLDKYQSIDEGQEITCIWTPPYTEVNGWMEQPSEIEFGYVITGTAHLPVKVADGDGGKSSDYTTCVETQSLWVDVDVHSASPLFEALLKSTADPTFSLPMHGDFTGRTPKHRSLWLVSDGVSTANVAGHIYLVTRSCETLLEALIRVEGDQIILAFHGYLPPIGYEYFILNNVLAGADRALFEHLISIAEPLEINYTPYLV